MPHVIPANVTSPLRTSVTPELAGWQYLSFRVHALAEGQRYRGESLGCEVALVFLSGDAEVKVNGQAWSLTGRRDVFAGLPYATYVPPDHSYQVTAKSGLELAVGMAPAKGILAPRLITPDEVKVEIRGGHNVTRQISHILDPGDAEKLLCVEVYTPSGNWSSYPPHQHDVHNPPEEVELEEVYHYRFQPQDGWAMQRLYTDDRSLNEVVLAKHGDTVLIRRGYHPVVTAPGYDCYYLNFLAGEMPTWEAKDDPQLAWVRGSWEGQEDRLRLPLTGTGR
ncbi:MAG: 5-deoxy-glucuronate isomerase [Truepera sp.]|nr:5-deoxy-glucuronate isomerase [Truepera sp.]